MVIRYSIMSVKDNKSDHFKINVNKSIQDGYAKCYIINEKNLMLKWKYIKYIKYIYMCISQYY